MHQLGIHIETHALPRHVCNHCNRIRWLNPIVLLFVVDLVNHFPTASHPTHHVLLPLQSSYFYSLLPHDSKSEVVLVELWDMDLHVLLASHCLSMVEVIEIMIVEDALNICSWFSGLNFVFVKALRRREVKINPLTDLFQVPFYLLLLALRG